MGWVDTVNMISGEGKEVQYQKGWVDSKCVIQGKGRRFKVKRDSWDGMVRYKK